jgi:DNA mismatch repair protein MLH1
LSIHCDPRHIDVNIHPTKAEVKLLNEDDLIEFVIKQIQSNIQNNVSSRLFTVSSSSSSNLPTINDKSFVNPIPQIRNRIDIRQNSLINALKSVKVFNNVNNLSSIEELILNTHSQENSEITKIISESKYIGCVEETNLIIIQHNTSLYILYLDRFSKEYFYQLVLHNFARLDICAISPLDVSQLLPLLSPDTDFKLNSSHLDLLDEYFSVQIKRSSSNGELEIVGLPLLLPDYAPDLAKLPQFLYKLNNEGIIIKMIPLTVTYTIIHLVNFNEEKECFHSISTLLSELYCIETTKKSNSSIYSTILFSSTQFCKIPKTSSPTSKFIMPIASLDQLYKDFERC